MRKAASHLAMVLEVRGPRRYNFVCSSRRQVACPLFSADGGDANALDDRQAIDHTGVAHWSVIKSMCFFRKSYQYGSPDFRDPRQKEIAGRRKYMMLRRRG